MNLHLTYKNIFSGLMLCDNYFLIFLKLLSLETGSRKIHRKVKKFKVKARSESHKFWHDLFSNPDVTNISLAIDVKQIKTRFKTKSLGAGEA